LDIKRAIPLGLITNELITNAYKYAYKNRDAGLLKVQFGQNGMQHFLEFSDDGPGMNLNMEKLESVGISLVGDLVEQLDGTIRFWDDKGAHVAILFPL
jgi:two-component sensor histidine kinase